MNVPTSIIQAAQRAHDQGRTVVLATGVFDLLHSEHIHFLQQAKSVGDVLLVGVESDVRVRQLKGEGRPVENQAVRVKKIKALGVADGVFVLPKVFDQPEHHIELLKLFKPDVLAVSSHTPHLEKKRQLMALMGGRVEVVLDQNPAVSTTQILAAAPPKE